MTAYSAENDRTVAGADGSLTPAARLARQHTLKAKEEEVEEKRRSMVQDSTVEVGEDGRRISADLPQTWEKNTTTRAGAANTRPSVEVQEGADFFSDSDEDERTPSEAEDVDDLASRLGAVALATEEHEEVEYSAWGHYPVSTGAPAPKGILKANSAFGPDLSTLNDIDSVWSRGRSNSSEEQSAQNLAVPAHGPLARSPTPDADRVDGIHRTESPSKMRQSESMSNFSPDFGNFEATFADTMGDKLLMDSDCRILEGDSVRWIPSTRSASGVGLRARGP